MIRPVRGVGDRRLLRLGTRRALVRSGFCLVLADLMLVLVLASPTQAYVGLPGTSVPPDVIACEYLPDPGSDSTYPCPLGETAFVPALVNVTFRLRLVVNDSDGDLANVTVYFDYLDFLDAAGGVPGSLVKRVAVAQGGPGQPVSVEANWTYAQLGQVIGENVSHYWIGIVATDASLEESVLHFFDLNVDGANSAPVMSQPNPSSVRITFPDPVVRAHFDIVVKDRNDDSLIVTWDWGDGTSTANITGRSAGGARILATHDYPLELVRLNETPRTARFDLTIHVDDRIEGHNTSRGPFEVQFVIDPDDPPRSIVFVRPAEVGSLWKVGDPIPMEGFGVDPQGDSIEGYSWDFDSTSEPGGPGVKGDGIYDNDEEDVGNVTAHAYSVPENYTISLWATDGLNKKVCADYNASTCVEPKSHWRKGQWTVRVRPNNAPFVALTDQNVSRGGWSFLNATVSDPDGDSLTLTWSFGDGTSGTTNVSGLRPPGEPIREGYSDVIASISHDYPREGEFYELTVRVSDGNATDEATARVFVSSQNLPPEPPLLQLRRANGTMAGNGTYLPNETVRLEILLTDPENDTLEIHIAWGDGNETLLNVTLPAGNVTGAPGASCGLNELNQTICYVDHTYSQVGNYTVVLNLTDNRKFVILDNVTFQPKEVIRHHVLGTITLIVELPTVVESEGPWDWWDYGTFATLIGLPLVLLSRGFVRVYRERREE